MASPKSRSVLVPFLVLVLFSTTEATMNITRELSQYPKFSTFTALLNDTGLAKEINTRQTITILAVGNDAIGGLSGKPLDIVKSILSVHVILDYYDMAKLSLLTPNKPTMTTTLFQTTGVAAYSEGFLKITPLSNHDIRFGSAVKGAPALDVKLIEVTDFTRYNFSIIQVSGVIFTPGIDGNTMVAPPNGAPKKSPVAPSPKGAPSPDDDDDDDDESAPEASPPAESPADAPVSSPPVSADAPAADDEDGKTAAPPKSSAVRFSSTGGFFTALVGVLVMSSFAAAL